MLPRLRSRRHPFLAALMVLAGCGDGGSGMPEPPEPTLFPIIEDLRLGFINASGDRVIEPRFDLWPEFSLDEAIFVSDRLPVRIGDLWGFVDTRGDLVVNPQFEQVAPFSEGLAPVRLNKRWGFIDPSGKMVIQPGFEEVGGFTNGLSPVMVGGDGGRWGVIDTEGGYVINPQYDFIGPFIGGRAVVQDRNRWGFIDRKGELKVFPQFDDTGFAFDQGVVPARLGDRWGLVDPDGKWVVNAQYDDASYAIGDRLWRVRLGQRWGFVNLKGDIVVNFQYDDALDFKDGYAAVRMGSTWGFIDPNGALTAQPQFDDARDFNKGRALVRLGDGYGFVDPSGRLVVNPQYDDAAPFRGALARVRMDDRLGYVNTSGEVVHPLAPLVANAASLDRARGMLPSWISPYLAGLGVPASGLDFRGSLPDGKASAAHTFFALSGVPLVFDLMSDEFDTVLTLYEIRGEDRRQVASNDDGGDGSNSRLVYTPSQDRTFEVAITSYWPDDSGSYTLRVQPRN